MPIGAVPFRLNLHLIEGLHHVPDWEVFCELIRSRVNRSYAVASLYGLTINRYLHTPRLRRARGKFLTGQRRYGEIHDTIFPCV